MLPFRAMSQGQAAVSVRHASGTRSPITLLRQGIRDILSRRRLIRYLTQAEMRKRGSDTILGNLWWILDPLLQMGVFVIFVTIIRQRPAPDYPLFILAAILPWKWYSSVITDAATSVVRRDRLIRQIAFPKIVLPMSTTTAGLVGFVWGLIPLGLIVLLFPGHLSLMLIWIPLIAAVQYVFTLGSAILVSAANVYFRDLGNALTHFLRLWWFLSPGLYSLAWVHDLNIVKENPILGFIAGLNPFAVLFESYRAVIYGRTNANAPTGFDPPHPPDLVALLILLVASVAFVAVAVMFFKRVEPNFAKVL